MNKKAFTLVELLAVIVLIALILGIAVISYSDVVKNTKNMVYKTYEDTMKASAMEYLIDHPEEIPSVNNMLTIGLNKLEIDQINNPDDKNDLCLNSYVTVKRNSDKENNYSFSYEVCLKCNSYSSSICK